MQNIKIIPKGTVVLIKCDTGYANMNDEQHYRLTSDYTEQELDEYAWQEALNFAESYGIYPDSTENDEEEEYYSGEDISGYWEIVEDKDIPEEDYISEM